MATWSFSDEVLSLTNRCLPVAAPCGVAWLQRIIEAFCIIIFQSYVLGSRDAT